MRVFKHRGARGDIIYSLPLVISYGGGVFCIEKKDQYDFLHSLLEKQPYLKDVKCGVLDSCKIINLNVYRRFSDKYNEINLSSSYLTIFNKKYNLSKPWLQNISSKFIKKIVLNRSSKYHNKKDSIDYSLLEPYKEDIVFIGFKKDYLLFKNKYKFNISFHQVEDALEIAQIIKGSKFFVGNQSLCYAIAEAMKHPRILEEYSNKPNCSPCSSNGLIELSEGIINKYLSNNIILPAILTEDQINESITTKIILGESDSPVVFLPNYGEFGSTVHKLIRMVHFHRSPRKIVCCRKGEESLFPSADEFYYDWNDGIDDIHRWGFFTKQKFSWGKNNRYKEYKDLLAKDFAKIESIYGKSCRYVHLWPFNKDEKFSNYAHLFKVDLRSNDFNGIKADIVISPRKRSGRKENNFLHWEELIDVFNHHGYTVGCIGDKHHSLTIEKSCVNSWDYEDNAGVMIELLNNCKLYLGLDTGVSHLAAMLSVPMIVFSHSDQRYYLTYLMERVTSGYFLDLGKKVKDNNIIIDNCLQYLGELKEMGHNNDFNYGTMTNVDVKQIEKSLITLKEEFGDAHVNILEIGIDKGRTSRAIHNKLSLLGITNYTYWAIDNNSKTVLPFADCKMLIGNSEELFHQLPELHWVFIDGCHCVNHIMLDFLNYGYKVVKNGILLFHDTGPFSQGHHYQKHGPDIPEFYIAAESAFKKLDIFNRKDWIHISSEYDSNNKEWGGVSIFKKIKESEKMINYKSKEGQDRWVVDKMGGKKNGYFVDLGASGGIVNSNSYTLEKCFDWQGICVEPNPNLRAFPTLVENRDCICENVCIYNESRIVNFLARGRRIESSGIYSDCSSVIIKHMVENKKHPLIEVKAITLMELLDKHNAPSIIDYINIDTEGSEWEILKDFDFNKYTFLTMTIEHNYWEGTNWDEKEKIKRDNIRELLHKHSYIIDNELPWEDWFVHKDI